ASSAGSSRRSGRGPALPAGDPRQRRLDLLALDDEHFRVVRKKQVDPRAEEDDPDALPALERLARPRVEDDAARERARDLLERDAPRPRGESDEVLLVLERRLFGERGELPA